MLSEEQAIEKLKKIREDTIKANECGLSNNDFKEEIEVYDVILNLITKLQKENEELKTTVNKQSIDISNNLIELQQKDKQIYLMVEKIYKRISAKELNKYCNKQKNNCKNYKECFNCIKQYFENKAKGE